EVEFDIMYGLGVSKEGELIDIAAKEGIIDKAGAWYSYNDAKIGQGRENAKTYLMENLDIQEEIKTKILAKYGLGEDAMKINHVKREILEDEEIAAEIKKTKKSKNTLQ